MERTTSWSEGSRQVADELAVDLDEVDRKVAQVVDGAEAAAEVVEGHAAAEGAQSAREAARVVEVGDPRSQ